MSSRLLCICMHPKHRLQCSGGPIGYKIEYFLVFRELMHGLFKGLKVARTLRWYLSSDCGSRRENLMLHNVMLYIAMRLSI